MYNLVFIINKQHPKHNKNTQQPNYTKRNEFYFILNYKNVFTIPSTSSYHLSVAVVEHKPSEAEVVVDNKVVDNTDHFDQVEEHSIAAAEEEEGNNLFVGPLFEKER